MHPPVCNPDLWAFELETGVRVASKAGNLHSKFGHARPLGSRINRYVRDGRADRQMDRRTDKSNASCPLPYGRGIMRLHFVRNKLYIIAIHLLVQQSALLTYFSRVKIYCVHPWPWPCPRGFRLWPRIHIPKFTDFSPEIDCCYLPNVYNKAEIQNRKIEWLLQIVHNVARAFAVAGPRVWNSLPPAIRDPSLSLSIFGKLLKTYLFV